MKCLNQKAGMAIAIFAGFSLAHADPFVFNAVDYPADTLLGLRKTGGSFEMLVNLGPVARFKNVPAGTTITLTDFSADQLNSAFDSLDSVSFAVFSALKNSSSTNYPGDTIWATKKRTVLTTAATPWVRQDADSLAPTATVIDGSIAGNAVRISSSNPAGIGNTTNVLVETSGSTGTYGLSIGGGNFGNTFQGRVETTTPANFVENNLVSRADFFEILPGAGPSTRLGYFEFSAGGVMTFTAAGGTVAAPAPTITAIGVQSGAVNVSFTTVTGAQYTLLKASALNPQVSTWTTVGSAANGTGSAVTLSDANPGTTSFYAVKATP
jgi:hypothetical protein